MIYAGLCLRALKLHFYENKLKHRDYLPHYTPLGLVFGLLIAACMLHLGNGMKAIFSYYPTVKENITQPDPG
jgi:hypothetical protein